MKIGLHPLNGRELNVNLLLLAPGVIWEVNGRPTQVQPKSFTSLDLEATREWNLQNRPNAPRTRTASRGPTPEPDIALAPSKAPLYSCSARAFVQGLFKGSLPHA